ncbi:MAG: ribonuclease Z [Maribacter sp.]|nr:MAG: ribonuclease Z [Maribacter sp.]
MILVKDNTTTIVSQENILLQKFIENVLKAYPEIKKDNIIINLFSFSKMTAGDILEFLQISNEHRASKKSFVLVSDKISFEEIPDEICVVPTIQEAKDIIEMEEMERDLGL